MNQDFVYHGKNLQFKTSPGVFAQYGLDMGSKVLLESIELPSQGKVLDLGCGCGFIGLCLAKANPGLFVTLVDSDIRAIRLTQENAIKNDIKNIEIILSDVDSDINPNDKFDLVVSNPPTHQGREVLIRFIQGSRNVLGNSGVAYFVVNRIASTMKKMQEVFGNSEKIVSKQGYMVFKSYVK